MSEKMIKTVLDAELLYLSRESAGEALSRGAIPLQAAAAANVAMGYSPQPSEKVTVKLIARSGRGSELSEMIQSLGGEVVSQSKGNVVVADVPADKLRSFDQEEFSGLVRRVEAPRQMNLLLDEARGPVTGTDSAVAAHGLSGEGVVVGVIDSGLDYTHQDFRNEDGTTRLEAFIHAFLPEGSEISSVTEFSESQINDAIQGNIEISQGDPHGHGTHCASIAAGNGLASGGGLRGAAPRATLMAMRSEPLLDTHTIQGLRRFFELAGDRPAVVNMSFGGHVGPHDGTSAIENVIAQESGPGRVVVVAGGNEGGDAIHWGGELEEGETTVIPFRVADSNRQVIDIWIPRGDEVEVQVETPDGQLFDADGSVQDLGSILFLASHQEDPINRDQEVTVILIAPLNETWRIHIHANQVLNGEVHAWGATADPNNARQLFPGVTDSDFSVGMPATEEQAVSVGSFVSRKQFPTANGTLVADGLNVGQLSPFSSLGPTRIGRQKPDIAAPGQFVTAALASDSVFGSHPNYVPRHDPSGNYITIQGTSMAAPFVTGVIALMLQREPDLTPAEISDRLRVTATRDGDTARVWGPGFGYGKLNVQDLLDYEMT